MIQEPTEKPRSGISPIWILPIIALCICSWLLYSSYRDAGVEITIFFDDASGIVPGKTQVMSKGIPVGLVKTIDPDLENQQIVATVKMEKEVVDHLVDDTLFWIVRPELSASSVRGLDTILSGSYIGIQIGVSDVERREFKGLSSPPPISVDTPGLHIQLRAEVLGSIQVGTGIYYRNIEIGKVQKHQLERDENILIDLFIEPQFTHLVRLGSRFCNASGIQISGKLPNVKIQIESLASLMRGGILLHTPDQLHDTLAVQNGHIFSLYPDYESANYGIPMTLTLASGEDIVEGSTKVMYRGLEAGFVKEIKINNDPRRTVTAHILLDPRAELILRENTSFWLVKPEISPSGISNLRLLLSGAHITFQPGDGEFKDHFNILPEPPFQPPLRSGKTYILQSEGPAEVAPKSPIYFKNIPVGEVVDVELDNSGLSIHTTIFIYDKYLHLMSKKSVFWLHSGVTMKANLENGFHLSTGPLAKLIHGGISFTSPDKLQKKKNFAPEEGFEYQLFTSYSDAVNSIPELQKSGKIIHITSKNASSLSVNGPVLHKNIKIGEIEDFNLSKNRREVVISCFIYDDFTSLVNERTRFYNTSGINFSGGLDGIQLQAGSLQSILAGGIGTLNLESVQPKPADSPYLLHESLQAALQADKLVLKINLRSTKGLKKGSSVRYKGITVGKVSELNFNDGLEHIVATALVHPKFGTLFRENTSFWVAEAEINLGGVKNVETIVFGSYLSFLPGKGHPETFFNALDEPPRTAIANQEGLGIVLETKHLGSLSPGSPVYYRQVQIGRVTDYELSPTFQKVFVFISIKDRYRAVIRKNTKFWNISGAKIEGGIFSGLTISTGSIESIMRGGIALATPDDGQPAAAAVAGEHFTLHEDAKKQWLDWDPDIVLLQLEESESILHQNILQEAQ